MHLDIQEMDEAVLESESCYKTMVTRSCRDM